MSDKKYLIVSPIGSGNSFVRAVFGIITGVINVKKVVISNTGDAHDIGAGPWNLKNKLLDFYAPDLYHTKEDAMLIAKEANIVCTHCTDLEHLRNYFNNYIFVGIYTEPNDYRLVSHTKTIKQHAYLWNESEYNKIKGSDWPPYEKNNVLNSSLIRNELINAHNYNYVRDWYNKYNKNNVIDYTINVRSVFGIDSITLVSNLEKIFNKPVPDKVCELILKYQRINKKLYYDD